MQSMKQLKNRIRRMAACLLSIVLLITGIPFPVFAETAYEDYLDGWKVQCAWSTLSQDYEWNAKKDETRQPKIVVTYRLDNAAKDYPAGSLQFEVPGIGNANRANVVKADKLAADAEDSEWSYTWDSLKDIYTFTNKFNVAVEQSVSGGFELLWTLDARDCADGFEQKKSPVFRLNNTGTDETPESKSITLRPLSYRFTSIRDRYRIQMSGERLTPEEYDEADKDYIWYDIQTQFDKDWLARGLYKSDYYVSVELPEGAGPEHVQIKYGGSRKDLTLDENGTYGFYPFQNRYGNIGSQYSTYKDSIQVGFQKDVLEEKMVTFRGHLDRLYQDESEWVRTAGEFEKVDDELKFTVEDYSFQYHGFIYSHSKRSSYQSSSGGAPYDYTDRLNALHLYDGKVVQFGLSGSANRNYGRGWARRAGTATPSDASPAVPATPSNAEEAYKEEIPEGIEDWNDIHWRENRQLEEWDDTDRTKYGELYPEYWTATPSDAMEDEDGEVIVPDITFFSRGMEQIRGLFEIDAYAAETATPSDAAETLETKPGGNTSGQSQIGEEEPYSMILGDDKLAIFLKDGSIRNLKDEEYDITYVTVPSDNRNYDYQIFTAGGQDTHFDLYGCAGEGNTGKKETFRFADGVKAVYIKVNEIKGSYSMSADVGVRLHLDWAEQQALEEASRPDHENRLVNFSYLRAIYRDEAGLEVNDCAVETDSYQGAYGKELAERDGEVYQEQLYRDYANVWLRSPVTELVSGTSLNEFDGNGAAGYTSQIQTTGNIQADNPGTLERFSLYTVLPDGLQADFDNTEITIKGSGTDITGAAVGDTEFASHAIISTGEYKEKVLLKVDFDFSDAPLEAGQLTKASVGFPVTLSAADFVAYGNRYTVNSYLMAHDDGLDKFSGRAITSDTYDIDGDGMTTEQMAYSSRERTVYDDASEWREYVSKYVKSAFSGGSFVTDTVTRRYQEDETEEQQKQSAYSYRLDFGLGASNAKNIWFFDRMEQGARIADNEDNPDSHTEIDSEWQGEFQSVDTSYAEELGMIPTVYYSENPNQEFNPDAEPEYDPEANGWSQEAGETVKAIAVFLDTSKLEDEVMKTKQMVYVTVNMRAPAGTASIGKKAVNQYEVQYDGYGLTGKYQDTYTLPSAETYVTLQDSAGKLILQKVDADHEIRKDPDGTPIYAALTGATFQIYDIEEIPLFEEPKELNALGRIVVNNVPHGTYYWEEMTAPIGYEKLEGRYPFTVDGMQGIIQIENKRKPGSVLLTKYDVDTGEDTGQNTLPGAEFELYRADGEQVYTQSDADGEYSYAKDGTNGLLETGTDGTLRVSGLPWGSYYFVETKAPEGYETDGQQIPFSIGKADFTEDNVFVEVKVTAENSQLPASVILVKKDAEDGSVLKDAYYDLYKYKEVLEHEETSEKNWVKIRESLKTNAAGELIVEGLKFGDYRFVEVQPPRGYELNEEPVPFTLDASTVGELVEVGHMDVRKTGSAMLTKQSEDGMPLKGAKFALYKGAGEETEAELELIRADMETDDKGQTEPVTGLAWGDYYFLETAAPEGYVLNEAPVRFSIDADNAEAGVRLSATNQRKRGSVVLTKMDEETKELRLGGAVFNLYRQDGTLVLKDVTTKSLGEDGVTEAEVGMVRVDNLDWGSYYFEETKAPAGFGLYPGKIRFSVNSQNSSVVQQLTCYDPAEQVQITIHKEINKWHDPFGVPTFLFRIAGMDESKVEHEWIKSLTLDGVTEGTVILSGIPAGTYTVTELDVERYRLVAVESADKHVTLSEDGKSATAVLVTEKEAEVTFINEITQYEKYSHVTTAANLVNAERKITAFEVTYLGPDVIESETESEYTFVPKDLNAVLHYDDGKTETVPFGELELDPETVTGNQNTSGSGQTVTVTHEVDGERFTDTFSVEVRLQVPKVPHTITYDANGGYFGTDSSETINVVEYLWSDETKKNECLSNPEKENAKPEHLTMMFDGWYTDVNCTDGNKFKPEMWLADELTEDIRVYAKWREPEAVLWSGASLNRAMKRLAGTSQDWTADNDNITAIRRSDTSPGLEMEREDVSGATSEVPIDMWFDNGTIYWWSKDKAPDLEGNCYYMCKGLINLTDISGMSDWDTSGLTGMRDMFDDCRSLTGLSGLSGWDVSNVTDMGFMFDDCRSLTGLSGLSKWDVSNVANMGYMFSGCRSLTDLSGLEWNVSGVINMDSMFNGCSGLTGLTELSGWNVSSVTGMNSMFSGCSGLTELLGLSKWDVSSVAGMQDMFSDCSGLTELSGLSRWNVGSVARMYDMFSGCSGLTELSGLSGWNVSSVTRMGSMFSDCSSLTELSGLSGWDVSNVTDISSMFNGCSSLTELSGVSGWDVSSVTGMSSMFYGCSSLTNLKALAEWNVGAVTNLANMFYKCSSLTDLSGLAKWNVGSVSTMNDIFRYCSSLTNLKGLEEWDVKGVTSLEDMFYECSSLSDLGGLTKWDVGSVSTMSNMFRNCSSLTDLEALAKWNVGSVKIMDVMFYGCSSLTDLEDLEKWSVGEVRTMANMFQGCINVTNLKGLAAWDVTNVTSMTRMFGYCRNLNGLTELKGWKVYNVTSMMNMFYECTSLTNLEGLAQWDVSSVIDMDSMFYHCDSLTDLGDLAEWDVSSVTNMDSMFYNCRGLVEAFAINDWDITSVSVTNFKWMFRYCSVHPSFSKRQGTWEDGTFTPES